MFFHSRICAFALAAALMVTMGGVPAAHDAKYPNWKGQWQAINPPFGDQIIKFDPTKRSGPWQQAPLTPEYQRGLEDSMADQAWELSERAGDPRRQTAHDGGTKDGIHHHA